MKRMYRVALIALVSALLAALTPLGGAAQSPAIGEKAYIELILDSSISMTARAEGSKTRMAVAQAVMEQLIRDLPDDPNLMVALRIYGAELRPDLPPCGDTVLVQPFTQVRAARQSMIDQVKTMRARGMTPIALSLEQAAKDFPDKHARNVVILVTDGEESCGGDPCAVSAKLQAEGIILKPYVVGFALNDKQAAKVMCIGEFFSATDTASLKRALSTIMARAIAPAYIEVQAFAGPVDVTRQASIQITKSTGETVAPAPSPQGGTAVRAQVDEGSYSVQGWFLAGSTMRTASATVTATSGKTSSVRLDFGSLEGKVRVVARASGQDVSGIVGITALKGATPVTPAWAGVPPVATLAEGDYTFIVTHRQQPGLTKTAIATVRAGEETLVEVDLGDLPAGLEVTVTYIGAVVSNMCQLTVMPEGKPSTLIPAPTASDGRAFSYTSAPGACDLSIAYKGVVTVDKAVRGVQLTGGRTTPVTVPLDDVLGTLRVHVTAGGRDVSSEASVTALQGGAGIQLPYVFGSREAAITPGAYAVKAVYRGIESDPHEAYVQAGKVAELTIDIELPGTIVITPSIEGKPARADQLSQVKAWAQVNGVSAGAASVQYGRLEISVPAGTYTVVGEISSPFPQRREAQGVQVRSGAVSEVKMDFDPSGLIRLRVVSGGNPADGGAWVYLGGKSTGKYSGMQRVDKGLYELKVPEGVHDIEFDPDLAGLDNQFIRDVQVAGGGIAERTLDLGGSGVVRLRLILDGKPAEGNAWVYFGGKSTNKYSGMKKLEKGLWELAVPAGVHDIEVDPDLVGLDNQLIRGVEVGSGATVERTVDLGGNGLMRVRLLLDGKPADGNAWVYFGGKSTGKYNSMKKLEKGVWELSVPAGVHDIEIDPDLVGVDNQIIRGVEVVSGATVERTLDLGGSGVVRLRLILDGKPADGNAWVYFGGRSTNKGAGMKKLEKGLWELSVPAGVHDIEIRPDLVGLDTQFIRGVEVASGATVERTLDLGGSGVVRLRLTVDGKPADGNAWFYFGGKATGKYVAMKKLETGLWELTVPAGVHDIEVDPQPAGLANQLIQGVDVKAGTTVEKSLSL